MVAAPPNKPRQDKRIAGMASFTPLCVSDRIEGGSSWVNFRARSRWSPVRAAISARDCAASCREGAHVIVKARSNQAEADAVVREAQALGVRAISIIADMAKKEQVEAMAAKALSEFGRVDTLINNP